jgi:hypothetical protein
MSVFCALIRNICSHLIAYTDHCIYATVQLISEYFLTGPNGVHYIEVFLHLKKIVEVNHSFVYLTSLYYGSHQRDHDI